MPWQETIGYSFSESGILAHANPESGVFGLFGETHWIFIGYADNIQASLLALLARPDFLEEKPEGFTFEPWPLERCLIRRDQLVLEYYPSLNLKVSGLPDQPQESQPKAAKSEGPESPKSQTKE